MDDLFSQDEINALFSGGSFGGGDSDLSPDESAIMGEVATVFANAENSVIGMLSSKEVSTVTGDSEVVTQADFRSRPANAPFLFNATFGGFDDAPLGLVVEQAGALTLADLLMGGNGAGRPTEFSDFYLNAAQEGISQIVGSSFTSLSGLLGGKRLMPENTTSSLGEGEWLVFPSLTPETKIWASPVTVQIQGLEPFKVWAALPLDSALAMARQIQEIMGPTTHTSSTMSSPVMSAAPTPAPAAAPSAGMSGGMGGFGAPAAPVGFGAQQPGPMVDVHPAEFQPLGGGGAAAMAPSPIDMIADIPVRVTVELGKTRKNVSEILALTNGSVIELDKMAGEPVDILVNGKTIARGEVVVIDENFGVRITDIIGAKSTRVL